MNVAVIRPIGSLPNFSLIGANLDLAAIDVELSGAVARETRLRKAFENLTQSFDFIIIDTPPALGLLTLNALAASTEVLIPVDPGVFSLRGLAKLLETIEEVRAINPALGPVHALSNRTDYTNLASDVRTSLEKLFGNDLLETSIRRSVRIGEAQAAYLPVTQYRPGDAAAGDFLNLAQEIQKWQKENH